MELAKKDCSERIEELKAAKALLPEFEYHCRKENILRTLTSFIPSARSTKLVIMRGNGEITATPHEMAEELRNHWSKTFSSRPVTHKKVLDEWIKGCRYGFKDEQRADTKRWIITQQHIEDAIRYSNNSAPGPDGMPYLAWRCAGRLAVVVLHAAASQMQDENFTLQELPRDFNASFLCCLPKKPSGHDPIEGDYFKPAATRPLSLVNTDNRLIAGAFRLLLEPHIASVVTQLQRGFLRGRSMLQNVLDIDYESMRVSLKGDTGAIILFDFEAAFPSISQEYLLDMLHRLGLPESVIRPIRALYHDCRCWVKVSGGVFDGFKMSSGVRQGCPLSPLLFVLVVDILLRKLEQTLPSDTTIRAFADDVGMILADAARDLAQALHIYEQFSYFSGLKLNLTKTIVIPLWRQDGDITPKDLLSQACPGCKEMSFSSHGTYLGFSVGPDRESHIWEKATDKFRARADTWKEANQGLHHACLIYNSFVSSVMSYLWQLSAPNHRARVAEKKSA